MKISRKAFLTAAASLCMVTSVQAQAMKEINFGIISTDSSTALKSMWQPFMDDMAKATGMKINGFFATDYTGIIEGMRFGKVQVAWHGNKSAIEGALSELKIAHASQDLTSIDSGIEKLNTAWTAASQEMYANTQEGGDQPSQNAETPADDLAEDVAFE